MTPLSNDQTHYYLPAQTTRLLTTERVRQCQNLGLLLDKYPPQRVIAESKDKGLFKTKWLQEIAATYTIDTHLAQAVYTRWLHMTRAASAQHFHAITNKRIVVGLGGETVLETDLTLHHLYGFPFIPASTLKGVTRAYITGEIAEHKSQQIAEDDPTIQRIFGSPHFRGTVIFFDALPVHGKFSLTLDIINTHYPGYYNEKKLPTNDQNPNPITFLTVSDTIFAFSLAPRDPNQLAHRNDVTSATNWLQAALQEYGIGGKTSAGYGYFTLLPDAQT